MTNTPMMTRRLAVAALLMLPGLALLAAMAAGTVDAEGQTAERRVVRVTAERFLFTPSEIVVAQGEEIELRLKSDDTSHGFRIIGTDTNVALPKRGKGEVTVIFRGEKPGRYVFECSRMCGAGHNFMRGAIVVRETATAAAKP